MQWAISWDARQENFFLACLSTNLVSGWYCPEFVIMKNSCVNQQVTNVVWEQTDAFYNGLQCFINALVGTSEAACPPIEFGSKKLTKEEKNRRWNQWLAGLIDGDGCFLVSNAGYPSLEISVHMKDKDLLSPIKQHYGGSIKPRAGFNAVRYRLHHREGIERLCMDVNGFLRHPIRMAQFVNVCKCVNTTPISADKLSPLHGWFAGMFDADGTVTLNNTTRYPQITISVCQKYKEIPLYFMIHFGGGLYMDKSHNMYWKWSVQSKQNVLSLIEYFKHFPCRSSRRSKLLLIPQLYEHIHIKSHLPENKLLHKKWHELITKWDNL